MNRARAAGRGERWDSRNSLPTSIHLRVRGGTIPIPKNRDYGSLGHFAGIGTGI